MSGGRADAEGELWADRGLRFDRVFVGPRRRQRQTCEAVAEVYRRRGLPWPEPRPLAELDEHCGPKLVARRMPETDPPGLNAEARLLRYLEEYQEMTRRWARGEIETPQEVDARQVCVERFARAVLEGAEIKSTLEDGLANSKAINAIFTAGREMRWVNI